MAKPSEKLAESLEILHKLQQSGIMIIRSEQMSRIHRERLCQNGFLQGAIKGWYIPSRPDELPGDSTTWYTSFWQFCGVYLQHLKGKNWCLSPEQSLSIHANNWTVPHQLLVRASKARNNITYLPHDTSLFEVRATLPDDKDIIEKKGLRLFTLPAALVACSPKYFEQNPLDMRIALAMIQNSSEVLAPLLEGGHSYIAGRLAGAFRNIGREKIANEIVATMQSAGYSIREIAPFKAETTVIFNSRERSPYANRIRLMWQEMRRPILKNFPAAPGLPKNIEAYLKQAEDVYVSDAYHSLSIEGYQVSAELIERVRSGNWNPEKNDDDKQHRNVLAARGYWQAHQMVIKSIAKILKGENAGVIVSDDHQEWYREMFSPGVMAGLIQPADLAGYRNAPVYIRRSMHVPPSQGNVRDVVPLFFELLQEEKEPAVRIVLGHFIFVYIHPYMDGNGRIARFLMNAMLASGGYPWTIVPVEKRKEYMAALEDASVKQNIKPFSRFLAQLIEK